MTYYKSISEDQSYWIRADSITKEGKFEVIEGLMVSYQPGDFENKLVDSYYGIGAASIRAFTLDLEECTEEEFLEAYKKAIKSFNVENMYIPK